MFLDLPTWQYLGARDLASQERKLSLFGVKEFEGCHQEELSELFDCPNGLETVFESDLVENRFKTASNSASTALRINSATMGGWSGLSQRFQLKRAR